MKRSKNRAPERPELKLRIGGEREPIVDRQKALEERFGDRLVLKQNWGEKAARVTDRVVKHAKQQQLDPSSEDKWRHDRYEGNSFERPKPKKELSVPVEEQEIQKQAPKNDNLNKVLVKNLPSDITRTQVEQIFSRYGDVKKAQVEEGFAIVSFVNNEGALQAHYITNHKKMLKINGSVIKVTMIED